MYFREIRLHFRNPYYNKVSRYRLAIISSNPTHMIAFVFHKYLRLLPLYNPEILEKLRNFITAKHVRPHRYHTE